MPTKFGLAQPVRRVEDPRLLKGDGRYTDDITLPGMLWSAVLRSPHAAATLGAIDTAAALAVPGVLAVYTGADLSADGIGGLPCAIPLKNRDGTPRVDPPHPVLAEGAVRHVGDPVAFIVAETQKAARDGAEAVMVEYDVLPSATDLATATDAGQPAVWPEAKDNVCFDWETGDKAKVDSLFQSAAHITKLTVVNNRVVVNSMEARAALADYADGRWTLHTNTQGGWVIKSLLGQAVFKVPEEQFRVMTPDVGGGFGMKLFLYAEHVLTCYASRKLGRPVKWVSERSEAFLSDTQGRDNITDIELALDQDNKFLALRTRNVAGMGAYLSTFAPMIPTMAGTKVLASVYGFQAIYANVIGVFTNTVPVDAYRGAGRPESNYVVERMIDAAAAEIGMDRIALRRLNMVKPDAMPYISAMKQTYDSGDFNRVLDAAMAKMDWASFETRRAASAAKGKKRGIGMAYYLEATGGAPTERAEIRFADDGFVDVFVGTQSTGQGHETAYVMLTADQLGIDGDKIRILQGDTDSIPTGGGTGGARSLYSEGQAILVTAASVIEKGKQAASEALEASVADIEFTAGRFAVVGTDKGHRHPQPGIRLSSGPGVRGETATPRWMRRRSPRSTATPSPMAATWPRSRSTRTPAWWTSSATSYATTSGKAVNPLIVRGQVHGGVAQGYGQAVLERTSYDPTSGQLLSGSLMDYALPRASDLPDIEVELIEVPCGTNPLGVKGAGEAGAVGSPPAMINAIVDALRSAGITAIDMPATPEKVWKALQMAA